MLYFDVLIWLGKLVMQARSYSSLLNGAVYSTHCCKLIFLCSSEHDSVGLKTLNGTKAQDWNWLSNVVG
jgi:hypothetical protein